ncbi:MAG: hypothetical protein PVF87_07255 [Acidimicrobiia bacterium]
MSDPIWALVAGGALTLALLPLAPIHHDETWFLVVVKRLLRGDRLYEDVFFGAGPLPVWVAAAVVRVTRAQLLVMRLLSSVYFIAGLAVAVLMLGDAGLDPLPVVALSVAAGGVHLTPFDQYGRWSLVTAMAAAAAVLFGFPWLAGLFVGLSIAGKYTTGLATAATLVPVSAVVIGLGFAARLSSGLVLTAAVVFAALGRRGIDAFLDRAVRNKQVYLRHGVVLPWHGARRSLGELRSGIAPLLDSIPSLLSYLVLLAGIVAVPVGLVLAIADGSLFGALGAALCLIGVGAAFPRFDAAHARAVAPIVALGAWLSISPGGALVPLTVVLGALAILASVGRFYVMARRAEIRWDVPGMRLLPVTRVSGLWPDETGDLVTMAGSEVFLFHIHAAAFYLSGGLTNPTPYDYPLVSTFGPTGQAEVIESIENGRIEWVCHRPMHGPLTAVELQDYLNRLTPLGECGLGWVLHPQPTVGA